jgi:intracellular septation protein A
MLILKIFWRMCLIYLIFGLLLSPLALYLPIDIVFIKWKTTFYDGLFSIVLLVSGLASKRGLIGLVKPSGIDMPQFIWPKIDIYFSVVFMFFAIANSWIAIFATEEQWVDFNLFVSFPMLLICTVFVSFLVSINIIKYERKMLNKANSHGHI